MIWLNFFTTTKVFIITKWRKKGFSSNRLKAWSLLSWHLVRAFVLLRRTAEHCNSQNLCPECSGDIWRTVPFIVEEYANCYVGLLFFFVSFSSLILFGSFQAATCHENHATKYNDTSNTIVSSRSFHDLSRLHCWRNHFMVVRFEGVFLSYSKDLT